MSFYLQPNNKARNEMFNFYKKNEGMYRICTACTPQGDHHVSWYLDMDRGGMVHTLHEQHTWHVDKDSVNQPRN
jgi:hypothetical protein